MQTLSNEEIKAEVKNLVTIMIHHLWTAEKGEYKVQMQRVLADFDTKRFTDTDLIEILVLYGLTQTIASRDLYLALQRSLGV